MDQHGGHRLVGSWEQELMLQDTGRALRAKARLACKTARERGALTGDLLAESVWLREQLRNHTDTLRTQVRRRAKLLPELNRTLGELEEMIEHPAWSRSAVGRSQLDACLPRDRNCAGTARHLVRAYLENSESVFAQEDASLIVSELATNAYQHGAGMILLSVRHRSGRLRIEVRDEGQRSPLAALDRSSELAAEADAPGTDGTLASRQDSALADGGRGLWIVEQLACDWGTSPARDHVWAELAPVGGDQMR